MEKSYLINTLAKNFWKGTIFLKLTWNSSKKQLIQNQNDRISNVKEKNFGFIIIKIGIIKGKHING